MTRTHIKHSRVYLDGVDISGYSRNYGPLGWMFDAEADACLTDEIKNILIGKCDITAGPINAFLDNDTAGLFVKAGSGTADHGTRNLMISIGSNAAPAAGDPCFAWKFEQTAYSVDQGSGFVSVNVPMGGASYASTLTYKRPWGRILNPLSTKTGVNSATGIDDTASSALGGIFVYHLTTSNGTVTLKAQHASTNSDGNFADLTGATSGSITAAVTPQSGMIAVSTGLTVNRYLRWQLVFGTASSATFTCAFIRNTVA